MSVKQFYKELSALRAMWGQRDFWTNRNRVELALKGIGFSYLNTECESPEERERVASIFDATIREFNRRDLYATCGI